jgi:hypothetical protein
MRLDEWQKYIEAQFLDDVEVAVTSPQTSEGTGSQNAAATPAPVVVPVAPDVAVANANEQHGQSVQLVEPAAPPSPVTTAAPTVSPAQNAPSVAPDLQPDDYQAPTPEFISRLSPLSDLDISIPDFDAYLPPSHPGARTVTVASSPIDLPIASQSDSPNEAQPHLKPVVTPPPATLSRRDAPVDAVVPVTLQIDAQPLETVDGDAIDTLANESAGQFQGIRRTPRSRARHARNVRPDNVPSGLSASELWATVPKHVQTLLALERLEEEQEVAQFSYKRPFQEKRHELIERLLDPILSLEDTARLLNVCPTTVRRYTNKGILTYYRKEPDRAGRPGGGPNNAAEEETGLTTGKETRQRRFRLSDILAFLETQQAALEADRRSETDSAIRKRRPHPAPESAAADVGAP